MINYEAVIKAVRDLGSFGLIVYLFVVYAPQTLQNQQALTVSQGTITQNLGTISRQLADIAVRLERVENLRNAK